MPLEHKVKEEAKNKKGTLCYYLSDHFSSAKSGAVLGQKEIGLSVA
jgi:hypothetical protein